MTSAYFVSQKYFNENTTLGPRETSWSQQNFGLYLRPSVFVRKLLRDRVCSSFGKFRPVGFVPEAVEILSKNETWDRQICVAVAWPNPELVWHIFSSKDSFHLLRSSNGMLKEQNPLKIHDTQRVVETVKQSNDSMMFSVSILLTRIDADLNPAVLDWKSKKIHKRKMVKSIHPI